MLCVIDGVTVRDVVADALGDVVSVGVPDGEGVVVWVRLLD